MEDKTMLFNLIKEYYDMGLYTKDQLKVFVQAGMITAQQYQEICGEPYAIAAPATSQVSTASSQASVATSTASAAI